MNHRSSGNHGKASNWLVQGRRGQRQECACYELPWLWSASNWASGGTCVCMQLKQNAAGTLEDYPACYSGHINPQIVAR